MKTMGDNGINGFNLQAAEVKLLAYADDVAILTKNQGIIIEGVKCVHNFSHVTGGGVNWSKYLWLSHGPSPWKPCYSANVPWATTPGMYFGIPLDAYRDSEQYWKAQTKEIRERVEK